MEHFVFRLAVCMGDLWSTVREGKIIMRKHEYTTERHILNLFKNVRVRMIEEWNEKGIKLLAPLYMANFKFYFDGSRPSMVKDMPETAKFLQEEVFGKSEVIKGMPTHVTLGFEHNGFLSVPSKDVLDTLPIQFVRKQGYLSIALSLEYMRDRVNMYHRSHLSSILLDHDYRLELGAVSPTTNKVFTHVYYPDNKLFDIVVGEVQKNAAKGNANIVTSINGSTPVKRIDLLSMHVGSLGCELYVPYSNSIKHVLVETVEEYAYDGGKLSCSPAALFGGVNTFEFFKTVYSLTPKK